MSQRLIKSKTIKPTPQEDQNLLPKSPPPPTFSQKALSQAFVGTAQLANLLPTGTLLAFQLLTPLSTNNGSCDVVNRLMTQILLFFLSVSAFLACFTDSVRSPNDSQIYYGFITRRGMWLFDYPTNMALPDLSKYRLRLVDGVHAVLSVLVFASVALRDKNVVNCFYPQPQHVTQEVLDVVPLGVGLFCSSMFLVFPTRRHGIGYPMTNEH